jgi:glyoxylase-like metal-dependent hydrolase (beta-lactamase superfamily II)
MELREIARGVYACLQPDRGLGTSNSGLVERGGGLVIDTFWDLPHTRHLIETYARVWAAPARRVVNTHHNGDHCWGNQLFAGAEIIGHRMCAAAFGRERPEFMQALRDGATSEDPLRRTFARLLADWDFAGIELVPPTTLVDDRLVLDLDGTAVELRWVGPAHTAGDLILHLPAERVVFTGDVLFRLCTPIGWEGTFARWIAALDEIVALEPAVVVPGHGPLCGVEGPREMQSYLRYVRAEAACGFEAGLSPLATARRIDLGPYAGWTEPERIVFQVERAYRELRGEPWDTPLDVTSVFGSMLALRAEREAAATPRR